MDVDNIQQGNRPRAPLTPQEQTQLMQGNGCFYCRKTNVNHRATNCPEKARGPRRQVNVVHAARAPAPTPAPAPAQA